MNSILENSFLFEQALKTTPPTSAKSAASGASAGNSPSKSPKANQSADTFARAKKLCFTGNLQPGFAKNKGGVKPPQNVRAGAPQKILKSDAFKALQNVGTFIARNVLGVTSIVSAAVGVTMGGVGVIFGALMGVVAGAVAGKPILKSATAGAKMGFFIALLPGIALANAMLNLQESAALAQK